MAIASRGALQRRHPYLQSAKQNSRHHKSRSASLPLSTFLRRALAFLLVVVIASVALLFLRISSFSLQVSPHSAYRQTRLLTTALSHKDVIHEADRSLVDRTQRHLNSSVLAYVTPWNGKGYDMAKKFRMKFTHVSPVWYQLRREGDVMKLHGKHDADLNWIEDVRIDGQPMILPRVVLEGWTLETMLVQKEERMKAINMIVTECKNMGYDGIVLEAWSTWVVTGLLENATLRQKALQFIRDLGSKLHNVKAKLSNRHLQLIFVIPPPSPKKMDLNQFTPRDMVMLDSAVDGFSLMTYDFSNSYHPGPSAPLLWVRACLNLLLPKVPVNKMEHHESQLGMTYREGGNSMLAKRLLMGINFYGNDFLLPRGGKPIVGQEYLALLRKYRPTMEWDAESKEHYFEYSDGTESHRVFYPSLKYLALRIQEAKAWGVGISIWEIGQGLEYFFDLL